MQETPQERQEAARVRRRLLNLGEILAIAAVVISGLTLWNSYSERTHSEAQKTADEAQSVRKAATLTLRATPDKDGRVLTLTARGDDQSIQGQTIRFPSSLKLPATETSGDARIERGWFDDALVKARRDAGAPGDVAGDARLPVLIDTRFLANGDPHRDRAVYEIGYATSHSLIGGTSVHLKGLSRITAVPDDTAGQKKVDARWKALLPAVKP